ncbi:hypothetical protein GOBAR_DD01201 [Gossypium barbadense]|nr:hypothetical protein GOBAR_DD01201 [Gossypium barbadense]
MDMRGEEVIPSMKSRMDDSRQILCSFLTENDSELLLQSMKIYDISRTLVFAVASKIHSARRIDLHVVLGRSRNTGFLYIVERLGCRDALATMKDESMMELLYAIPAGSVGSCSYCRPTEPTLAVRALFGGCGVVEILHEMLIFPVIVIYDLFLESYQKAVIFNRGVLQGSYSQPSVLKDLNNFALVLYAPRIGSAAWFELEVRMRCVCVRSRRRMVSESMIRSYSCAVGGYRRIIDLTIRDGVMSEGLESSRTWI